MLENPERDLGLNTRAPAIEDEPEEMRKGSSLAERIVAARRLEARPEDGCRDCWTRGRDAALVTIGADPKGLAARIETARAIVPIGSELHWRACWERGRDAALEVIEGR